MGLGHDVILTSLTAAAVDTSTTAAAAAAAADDDDDDDDDTAVDDAEMASETGDITTEPAADSIETPRGIELAEAATPSCSAALRPP